MKRTFLLLIISFFSTGISFGQQPLTSTPIKLVKGLIFFELRINDSQKLNFLFDSGAGVSVLDSAAAKKVNLTISGPSRVGTSSGVVTTQSSVNNTLTIEDLEIKGISFEILSLTHLSKYFKIPIAGIIGYDLFSRFVVETNIDLLRMKIYDADSYETNDRDVALPMISFDHNKIGIEVILTDDEEREITLPLTIDTASDDYLWLFPQAHSQYDFLGKRKRKAVKGFSASPSVFTNYKGKVRAVSFGGKTWKKVMTTFAVGEISVAAFQDSQSNGLIGQNLLLDFNVIYDYKHHRVFLQQRR